LNEVDAIQAVVSRVIDGSTLDAQVNGQRTPVGYLGAETPPANTPCGMAALARNRELAGATVLLKADLAYDRDRMGRSLYYAYTPDGVWIDQVLVGEGLAHAVRLDGTGGADLAAAEAEARSAGRGCLWSDPAGSTET
jgi:endonuclease YncB( thermonuclease family)